jgi:hypothetical protein
MNPIAREFLQAQTVPELKAILKQKGLKLAGKKAELIDRIIDNENKNITLPLLKLPVDILGEIAIKLPLKYAVRLCVCNKKLYTILQNITFWQNMMVNETGQNVSNKTIDWYKEKIRYYPEIRDLAETIRHTWKFKHNIYDQITDEKFNGYEFITKYNEKWDDFEIVENLAAIDNFYRNKYNMNLPPIPNLQKLYCMLSLSKVLYYPLLKHLNCYGCKLTTLPEFPNLESLQCGNNKLTGLPYYPKLKFLECENNKLTSLRIYPELKRLNCSRNHLTTVPIMPKLEELNCIYNHITALPDFPMLRRLSCKNNLLSYENTKEWREYKNKGK